MEDIKNYTPEHIDIVIPNKYEQLPQSLFDGAKSLKDVQKVLHKEFVTTNEEVKVFRHLDAYEIHTIRSNYSELLETKLPVVKEECERIQDEAKKAAQAAKDKVNACEANISDLVFQVRDGRKEICFEPEGCYCIPAGGYYLHFAWLNDEFSLIKVREIPSYDAGKIFSQGEQNVEAFQRLFGIDIVSLLDERKASQDTEINTENEEYYEEG